MKISYYDLFDIIAEEAGRRLSKYDNNPINLKSFSPDTTINAVHDKIKNRKRTTKPKIVLRLLIAALIIMGLAISGLAITNNLFRNGAAYIDDTNKELIGKELPYEGEVTIKDKSGNIISGKEPSTNIDQSNQLIEESTIIKSIDDNAVIPSSINYFPVKQSKNFYTTPEVIFTNGAMIVFTKEDGSGWNLKHLETLTFETEMYPSEITYGRGQGITYGYIYNGELITENNRYEPGLDISYNLQADKEGEYYICLIGASSDSIALKEGKIVSQ